MQIWTNCFSIKIFGCIKNNIMTNDYIVAYKVVQFVPFNLFIITNEYAFNSFKIQLRLNFLWHMNKCNITKETQITYESLLSHQTSFSVMLETNLVKIQIWTYVAITIAPSQKLWSNFMCCSMHHTFSTRVFSIILLCYSVYGMVVWVTMSFFF